MGWTDINLPGLPGLMLSHNTFWDVNPLVPSANLLHEAYHDFQAWHDEPIGILGGNIDLIDSEKGGLFIQFVDFAKRGNDDEWL